MKRLRAVFLAMLAALAVYWPIAALAGSAFISAVGTYQTTWSIGGTLGPMWADNAGALEAKDPTNSFFEVVRGATPVSNNDLTTKSYSDTHAILGDVTGTLAASVVSAISGTTPINVTPNEFKWVQGATGPVLDQVQQANGSNPANFTIAPQAPGAGASTAATGTPGSLVLALAAPVSTGVEAEVYVSRAGTNVAAMGPQPGGGTTVAGLWLGPNAVSPTGGNFAVQASSTVTYMEGSSQVAIGSGSQSLNVIGGGAHRGITLGYPGTLDAAGGDMVVTLNPVIIVPNAALSNSNNVTFYDNAGNLELYSKGLQWNYQQSSPTITQTTPVSDVATQNLNITSQAPFASATTNKSPGNVNITIPVPLSGGNSGLLNVLPAGTNDSTHGAWQFGVLQGNAAVDSLWAGLDGSAPSATNYVLQAWNSGGTYLNGIIGNLYMLVNGSQVAQAITSGIQFGNGSAAFGSGGNNIVGLTNSTSPSTAACSGGICFYANGGAFELNATNIQFPTFISNPIIKQNAQTTDVATNNILIFGQNAWSSATTHQTGGSVIIEAGAGVATAQGGSTTIEAGDSNTKVSVAAAGAGTSSTVTANTNFSGNSVSTELAAEGAGTINTQTGTSKKYRFFCRTTVSGTSVSCGTITIPSGVLLTMRVTVSARDVTAGTAAGSLSSMLFGAVQNVSGTATQVGSTTWANTSMNIVGTGTPSPTISTTLSTNTVSIKVAVNSNDNYDWVVDVDGLQN